MSEMKSCPHCGSEAISLMVHLDQAFKKALQTWHYIECLNCNARTGYRVNEAEAIAAWNRRQGEELLFRGLASTVMTIVRAGQNGDQVLLKDYTVFLADRLERAGELRMSDRFRKIANGEWGAEIVLEAK